MCAINFLYFRKDRTMNFHCYYQYMMVQGTNRKMIVAEEIGGNNITFVMADDKPRTFYRMYFTVYPIGFSSFKITAKIANFSPGLVDINFLLAKGNTKPNIGN